MGRLELRLEASDFMFEGLFRCLGAHGVGIARSHNVAVVVDVVVGVYQAATLQEFQSLGGACNTIVHHVQTVEGSTK